MHLPLREARLVVTIAAILNLAGMSRHLYVLSRHPEIPNWPPLIGLTTAIIVLITINLAGPLLTQLRISLLYFANTCSVATAFYFLSQMYAAAQPNWIAFQSTKMACLVVGLLAPGLFAGIAGIITHVLSAIYIYEHFPPNLQLKYATEVSSIYLYSFFGFLVLFYRMRTSYLQNAYAQAQADVVVAHRLASTKLELCDHMNIPLESLENSLEMLKDQEPSLDPLTARMDRAIRRLRQIHKILLAREERTPYRTHVKEENTANGPLTS
jgi:hypothetical protein